MTPLAQPSFRTSVYDFARDARWALRAAWSANAKMLIAVTAVALSRGVIPAAIALTARGLVNAALATVHSGTAELGPVVPWLLLGFVCTLAEALAGLANRLFAQRLYDDLNCTITTDILAHAATLDVASFDDPAFQDVLERAKENPAHHIAGFVTSAIASGSCALQVLGLLGILVAIEPLVVLILVLFTVPYLRFQWRLAARHHAIEHARATKRRWTHYFVSALTGTATVGEVQLLRLAPLLTERFRSLMAEFRDQDRSLHGSSFTRGSLFVLLTTSAIYLMFVRVAWRVVGGVLTLGDLAIFGGATNRLRNTLEAFVQSASTALEQQLYIGNVIEFFRIQPRVINTTGAAPTMAHAAIELRDVRFTYPGAIEPALAGISLHITPGETIALVGENGAGKTTLVKLIARLYDPDDGCILFNGVDLRALSREALQQCIAFVFQGFGRYEASAHDNIAYGDWQRLLADRPQVQRIAQMAGVDAMIQRLPHGYETMLGRTFGETDVSSGQWQQLAMARAFARPASLLILDEPTASLDARAESALFSRFRTLAKGRTTILVSHRFSTVRMASRIIVLDQGRIVESGTHDELLARAGSYAELYRLHHDQMPAGVSPCPRST